MDLTTLTEPLVELALTVLGLGLTWATVSLKNFITEKVSNEKAKHALLLTHDHLEAALNNVYEDMSVRIKEAAKDGFTKEEVNELRGQTLMLAKSHLGPHSLKKIMEGLSFDTEEELDRYLDSKIVGIGAGTWNGESK